jgi:hypothetical protein
LLNAKGIQQSPPLYKNDISLKGTGKANKALSGKQGDNQPEWRNLKWIIANTEKLWTPISRNVSRWC